MTIPKQPNSFPLRMPDELRARIEARASASNRSANAEIVVMLTAALDAESDLASIPTEVMLATVVKRLHASVQIVVSEAQAKKAGIGPKKK
ncbi:MAG: Arc family DNA-binding protein [Telluria sp.]